MPSPALRARGGSDLQATLAARAGMAAFGDATISWLEDAELGLADGFAAAVTRPASAT